MISPDDFRSMLGEGFHTAFRKATDSATADQIHRLIGAMHPDEWAAVLDFVADGFAVTYPALIGDDAPAPQPMPTGEAFLAEFTRPDLISRDYPARRQQ